MWAIFLRLWPDEPVYHALGVIRDMRDFTKCGRPVGVYVPFVPMKHAVKFGRPCKDCWPDA